MKSVVVCANCGQRKPMAGRGLCASCYQRAARSGELAKFALMKEPLDLGLGTTERPRCQYPTDEPCPNRVEARGLCPKHYKLATYHGELDRFATMEAPGGRCHFRDCDQPTARRGVCIRHYERLRDFGRKYGVTLRWFMTQVERQRGRCAICGWQADDPFELAVDHDHVTGRARGLLCDTKAGAPGCNMGLGIFGDDPERLRRAAAYVEGA